jgi:hypothetical protein
VERRSSARRGYGATWQRTRRAILTRDHHVCAYCGAHANTVDHVVPRIEGGTDDPANLVAACGSCNSARSLAWLRANRPRLAPRARAWARSNRNQKMMAAPFAPGRQRQPRRVADPIFSTAAAGATTAVGFGLNRSASGSLGASSSASGVLAEGSA